MSEETSFIEVFELKTGAQLDELEVPPGGMIPQRGDTIQFHTPGKSEPDPDEYEVVERHFVWRPRQKKDPAAARALWRGMQIFVRKVGRWK